MDWLVLVDEIKFTAWSWLYNNHPEFNISFVQWSSNIAACRWVWHMHVGNHVFCCGLHAKREPTFMFGT